MLCRLHSVPFRSVPPKKASQATCPSGWTSGAMAGVPGCFFLNNLLTDARTWGMSERYCQQLDARGHLTFFTANSSTSTTAFVTLCKTVTSLSFGLVTVKNAIWLGGFRDPVANVIRRLNYQLFVNTIWLSGEPSGSVGNKDC
uniref:C-type lectin domain-containing protein n=1 Tax=Romanomermis culicivorax TaxID=13658 RepID=A0A915JPG0_ROMCU